MAQKITKNVFVILFYQNLYLRNTKQRYRLDAGSLENTIRHAVLLLNLDILFQRQVNNKC